jgi:hypothetical protein
MLAFWNDKFLYWATVYFGGSPVGLWSLCAYNDEDCKGGQFCTKGGSVQVRGIATPPNIEDANLQPLEFATCSKQSQLIGSIYEKAQFCNGQSYDDISC